MSSPAKKRKLNNSSKSSATQSKGLEFFFAKQKQAINSSSETNGSSSAAEALEKEPSSSENLTDEELARKLQAEWDKEAAEAEREPISSQEITTKAAQLVEEREKDQPEKAESSTVKAVQGSQPESTLVQPSSSLGFGVKKTLTLQPNGVAEDLATANIPLDQSPLTFDPAEYVQDLKQHWQSEGGDASYALLTRCFVLVSATQSRIKIVDTLVNCLRLLIETDPSSLLPAVSPYCYFLIAID